MAAFCLTETRLRLLHVGTIVACSGKVCNGLYAKGSCPSVQTIQLPRPILTVQLVILNIAKERA